MHLQERRETFVLIVCSFLLRCVQTIMPRTVKHVFVSKGHVIKRLTEGHDPDEPEIHF